MILRESSIRLKYMEYVLPNDPCVQEVLKTAEGRLWKESSKMQRAELVCQWVAGRIKHIYACQSICPSTVLSTNEGTCLSKSVLLVSILRALGFSENEVFVAVLARKEKDFSEFLHAAVLLREDAAMVSNNVFLLDPSGGLSRNVIIDELLSSNSPVAIFNDKTVLTVEQ